MSGFYIKPIPFHNSLSGLTGGDPVLGEYYHLSSSQLSYLSDLITNQSNFSANTVNALLLYQGIDILNMFLSTATTYVQSVSGGTNIVTGGTAQNPIISTSSNPIFSSVFAVNMSGNTLFSANTDVSRLFLSTATTYVQSISGGTNIVTGGTAQNPVISISNNPTFSSVFAINLSGGTIYSGGVDISTYFNQLMSSGVLSITEGNNIVTGGTAQNPIISTSSNPTFSSSFSNNLSGSTIFSGGSDVSTLFLSTASTNQFLSTATTYVQSVSAGTNIVTGGTAQNPVISTSNNPTFSSVFANNVSGNTLFSANTDVSRLFLSTATTYVQNISGGTNIVTGGTALNPIISTSSNPTFSSVFATNLSGNTFFSGGSDVSTLFLSTASTNQFLSTATTYVQSVSGGTNIVTGGTAQNPVISTSSNPTFSSVFAINLSGGTLFSANTDVSRLFLSTATTYVQSISGGTNIVTGGTEQNPIVSVSDSPVFNSITANTIFSGTTDIQDLFIQDLGSVLDKGDTAPERKINIMSSSYGYGGSIIGGWDHSISDTFGLSILGGEFATTAGYNTSTSIVGGSSLYIENSSSSAFLGGIQNTSVQSMNSSIIGGYSNTLNNVEHSSIIGGIGNSILSDELVTFNEQWKSKSAIIGGYQNTLNNVSNASIIGSFSCTILGTREFDQSVIIAGEGSSMIGSTSSAIIASPTSSMSGSYASSIISGGAGRIYNSFYSSIIGGQQNVIPSGVSSVVILGGYQITAHTSNAAYVDRIFANQIFSGLTDISEYFSAITTGNYVQNIVAGTNITTGGTAQSPIISISLNPTFNTVSADTYSANTIFLSGTNLVDLLGGGPDDATRIIPGTNIQTGGTASEVTVSTISDPVFSSVTSNNYYGNASGMTGFTKYIALVIDGDGSEVSSGLKGYAIVPYSCEIVEWSVVGDVSGSCSVDLWKNQSIPTISDSIVGGDYISLTNEQIKINNSLSLWSKILDSNDIIAFNVNSSSVFTKINLSIKVITT